MQTPFDGKRVKYIFFDMDGTIIDTERQAATVLENYFRENNLPIQPEDARHIAGRTWKTAFDYLFSKYTFTETREAIESKLVQQYRHAIHKNLIVVPGVVEAIQSLSKQYRLAVVSGSSRREIQFMIDSLSLKDCFEFYLGCEDYPHSKPAPDGYLKAIQIMGAKPEECLVFEDSYVGIESSHSAGIRVAVVHSTNHFKQDTSRADWFLNNFLNVNVEWVQTLKLKDSC